MAFAPFMKNKGQIFLHDIRKNILLEAKRRIRRAGIQNVQFHNDKKYLLSLIGGKCDTVLLDVPCTGTGTLRRNPENKYKFSLERYRELLEVQRELLEESLMFIKPKVGRIVYTTCSLLYEENLSQVLKFCKRHGFCIENDRILQTEPTRNGMDGFFSVTLIKGNM